MSRYAVLDCNWVDEEAVTLCGHTGRELDRFDTIDGARALALQQMAYGDLGVVVVDLLAQQRIFPDASAGLTGKSAPAVSAEPRGSTPAGAGRSADPKPS
jgi:hypothetical protein